MEPPGLTFNKPVDVYLTHSAAEQDPSANYYDVTVQQLEQEWEDLETHHISKCDDLPSEIVSKHPDIHEYLPVVKASILNTCTLVVTTRIKSENITLVPGKSYVYSRIYGSENKLQISFPAGCVGKECLLNIKVFPADELLDDNETIDMKTVFLPVIEVSGQHKPFLQPVKVELTYGHHSLVEIDANLPPVGHKEHFTSRNGVLLQTQKNSLGRLTCTSIADEVGTMILRIKEDQVKIIHSVTHFCRYILILGSIYSDYEKLARSSPKVKNFNAWFWAVSCNDTPILEVYVAPLSSKKEVENELGGFKGCLSQDTVGPDTFIFFCVEVDSTHLGIQDDKCRFCTEGFTRMPNSVNINTEHRLKFVHFWKNRCENPDHSERNFLLGKVTISRKSNSQEYSPGNSLGSVPQAGPQKRQQPPCRLQIDEFEKVSQRIPHIWRRLAHQTKRFKAYEIEAIRLSLPGEGETSKALTMLIRYDEKGGTRKELADALKEVGMDSLSKEVLSGEYD